MKQWITGAIGAVLLGLGLTGLPVNADDGESDQACNIAVKSAIEQLKDKKIEAEQDAPALRFACRFNEHSAVYWQCVDDRVKDGQAFTYAQARCSQQSLFKP